MLATDHEQIVWPVLDREGARKRPELEVDRSPNCSGRCCRRDLAGGSDGRLGGSQRDNMALASWRATIVARWVTQLGSGRALLTACHRRRPSARDQRRGQRRGRLPTAGSVRGVALARARDGAEETPERGAAAGLDGTHMYSVEVDADARGAALARVEPRGEPADGAQDVEVAAPRVDPRDPARVQGPVPSRLRRSSLADALAARDPRRAPSPAPRTARRPREFEGTGLYRRGRAPPAPGCRAARLTGS